VVAPTRAGTAVGRHLERRGGDAGYMAMLDVPDRAAVRRRLADLGVRIVWQVELADVLDLHLHPKDVPGALVAVDVVDPPGSWRWGGPAWTGRAAPAAPSGGLVGLTVAVSDPATAARRWAAVAGLPAPPAARLDLDGGRQAVEFVPAGDGRAGVLAIAVALPGVDDRQEVLRVGATSIEVRPLPDRPG
jgi:hypothetical protein